MPTQPFVVLSGRVSAKKLISWAKNARLSCFMTNWQFFIFKVDF
ncbi:MAG: hypothetical protein JWP94_2923 [Mucilaginibacter sp.]|nr:hypothetical protein [Mucilaginibacter sp.]